MNLVSVVIPCYNQGKYLRETIESVLASTYKSIEIIIVNDGSTDNSEEIASYYQANHKNIKLINQTNQGVSCARNNGVKAAVGEYILPLDGDDLISADYIEKAIGILAFNQKVKVVYCRADKFKDERVIEWKLKDFSLYNLAIDNMIFVSSLFRKEDFLSVGGFSEDMVFGREDWEFWIKMLKNGGEVVKLPIVGFHYRLTSNSKRIRTRTKENFKNRLVYLNRKHSDFYSRELNGPLRKMRAQSKIFNTIMQLIRI